MATLITYSDYSLLVEYMCNAKDYPLLSYLLHENRLNVAHPETLSDIESLSQVDLFGDIQVVDCIDITSIPLNMITPQLGECEIPLFFRGGELPSLSFKKTCEQAGITVIHLDAVRNETAQQLISEYSHIHTLSLSSQIISKIIALSTNYQQLLSLVDIASAISEQDFFTFVHQEAATELYKLSVQKHSISRDISPWHQLVTQDEVQLALSLLCTKLKKLSSKNAILEVIKGDHLLKTSEHIDYMNVYKYTLFKITQTI